MSKIKRRWPALAALTLCVALIGVGCTKNAEAWDTAQLINAERTNRGIAPLDLDMRLVNKAQAWAETMAARGYVSHSVLTSGVGSGWHRLGENVGWAHSVGQAHNLFMHSASHRASILNPSYTKFGTGVAISNGRYFVVHVFGA